MDIAYEVQTFSPYTRQHIESNAEANDSKVFKRLEAALDELYRRRAIIRAMAKPEESDLGFRLRATVSDGLPDGLMEHIIVLNFEEQQISAGVISLLARYLNESAS